MHSVSELVCVARVEALPAVNHTLLLARQPALVLDSLVDELGEPVMGEQQWHPPHEHTTITTQAAVRSQSEPVSMCETCAQQLLCCYCHITSRPCIGSCNQTQQSVLWVSRGSRRLTGKGVAQMQPLPLLLLVHLPAGCLCHCLLARHWGLARELVLLLVLLLYGSMCLAQLNHAAQ